MGGLELSSTVGAGPACPTPIGLVFSGWADNDMMKLFLASMLCAVVTLSFACRPASCWKLAKQEVNSGQQCKNRPWILGRSMQPVCPQAPHMPNSYPCLQRFLPSLGVTAPTKMENRPAKCQPRKPASTSNSHSQPIRCERLTDRRIFRNGRKTPHDRPLLRVHTD